LFDLLVLKLTPIHWLLAAINPLSKLNNNLKYIKIIILVETFPRQQHEAESSERKQSHSSPKQPVTDIRVVISHDSVYGIGNIQFTSDVVVLRP
jgi:hypothetical protein